MTTSLYEVRADMSVILRTIVTATDEDDAIAQAKQLANDGLMDEIPNSGDIHGWEAIALPPAPPKREVVS